MNCQNFLKSIEGMWLVKNMEHLGQLYRLAGEVHPCECAQCEELKEAINKLQKECEEVYAKLVELRNNVKF